MHACRRHMRISTLTGAGCRRLVIISIERGAAEKRRRHGDLEPRASRRVGSARPSAYGAFGGAFTPDSVHTACAPHRLCTEHLLWHHQMKVSSLAKRRATRVHFVPRERPPAQHRDVVCSASTECGATLSCSLASSTHVLPFSSHLEHIPGCLCATSDAC